jgi:hypothetical protein
MAAAGGVVLFGMLELPIVIDATADERPLCLIQYFK